jgi:hypothetical protein
LLRVSLAGFLNQIMKVLRRRGIVTIALALVGAACHPSGPAGLGSDARRELERGREAAAAWIDASRRGSEVSETTAIALGYLERLRLGMGSPFRLAEYALRDPRMDEQTRAQLAWAILARTIDRASYQIDPAALDRATLIGFDARLPIGQYHLELIESTVRESTDPRAGELAVRLAYALAAAEGTLASRAPELAARAAALLRDREVARDDALRFLRVAGEQAEPLRLLIQWRLERRFEVEAPLLRELPQGVELEAMGIAPRLARALRETPHRMDGTFARPRTATPVASLLPPAAAKRLAAIADSFNAPPQTPIVVAVQAHGRELAGAAGLSGVERTARKRFVKDAISEERFVAGYALLPHRDAETTPALMTLGAAVALRAYAQEPVWFPGFGGPSSRELEVRYRLASIRFDPSVEPEWRPYFRRMLDAALTDLYRVLPSLDLKGLNIVFGNDGAINEGTLALHDPRFRRLMLPPRTAAGTIAHEVAHDLDWQVALRRYRVRGDYASDRAARTPSDHLAVRLNDLASASLEAHMADEKMAAHGRRPAEIFARNIDWFVAVSLAAEGRTNGYLTSVQDDVLTGYGTVKPPDISGAAGDALVTILDEVAPVYPATREWFLKSYGLNRALTPYDLARRVLEVPGSQATVQEPTRLQLTALTPASIGLLPVERARAAGFAAIDAWVCRAPGAAYNRELEDARRHLVIEAAAARARGLALSHARSLAGDTGRRWVARQLYGALWPNAAVDSAMSGMLQSVVDMSAAVANTQVTDKARRFDLLGSPPRCAAAPLRN